MSGGGTLDRVLVSTTRSGWCFPILAKGQHRKQRIQVLPSLGAPHKDCRSPVDSSLCSGTAEPRPSLTPALHSFGPLRFRVAKSKSRLPRKQAKAKPSVKPAQPQQGQDTLGTFSREPRAWEVPGHTAHAACRKTGEQLAWSTTELTDLPIPVRRQDTHTWKVHILHRSPFAPTLPFLPPHLHHPPLQGPETEKTHSVDPTLMFSLSFRRSQCRPEPETTTETIPTPVHNPPDTTNLI